MRSNPKNIAFWLVLLVLGIVILNLYQQRQEASIRDFDYDKFTRALEDKKLEKVSFDRVNGMIRGQVKPEFEEEYGGKEFIIPGNVGDEGFRIVRQNGITPIYEENRENGFLQMLLVNWLPLIVIVGLFIFLMRQIQVGGGKAMSFGKSRAKLLTENKNKVTFKDVAGVDEAKEELEEIVSFLKDPKKYTRLGGRIPKGVLLVGPPGTGKTLLARAVAGEAGVPFFTISGSDFVEMFVGVGASRVRDLFEQGKRNAPCLIFIDEIDAVGRQRGAGMGGGHDEREQTLNQMLVEMDGFESNEGVILIAATNRPDVLDPALLRPGRFDRRVIVNVPDILGRQKILEVHAKKTPLATDVALERIARGTPGFSGADLENLVNESALIAAREERSKITMADMEKAKDKVMMGAERKSMVISPDEKKNTAYHEAGHALVGVKLPKTDSVHKVTIIPRGMALGLTQFLPKEDQRSMSKIQAESLVAVMYGGRVAEELFFEDYTTGASNDIERATEVARRMVCEWGMSEKLGPLAFQKREGPVFLGKQMSQGREYSEAKAEQIDAEVSRIINEGYSKAKQILKDHEKELREMAEALIEFETIDGEEVLAIVNEGATVESLRTTRDARDKKMKEEQKIGHEELQEKEREEREAQEKANEGGDDPVGNTGPVTA